WRSSQTLSPHALPYRRSGCVGQHRHCFRRSRSRGRTPAGGIQESRVRLRKRCPAGAVECARRAGVRLLPGKRRPRPMDVPRLMSDNYPIAHYIAHRAIGPITVDGRLDEPVWHAAPPSTPFIDIVTGEPAWFDTRVRILWDDQYLYFGF